MTSIISAISGQFSKSLILGTLFPIALFVALGLSLVAPLLPPDTVLRLPMQPLGAEWRLVAVSLVVVVLSGVLYNLNTSVIRLFEGYPWQHSWLGRWRTRHYQRQHRMIQARWKGLRTLLRAMGPSDPDFERVFGLWTRYGMEACGQFPQRPAHVLPTRLGNVIRSFEDYSDRQYGMESITLWPRLVAKIDKDYAASIDNAKVGLDFSLNVAVLSALLAMVLLVLGLVRPVLFVSRQLYGWWLLEIGLLLVLAHGGYRIALGHAASWGELVKGAFDLYRWDLLSQLGYQHRPRTGTEERAMWNDIYQPMLYGDSPSTRPPADYGPRQAVAVVATRTANFVYLDAARGIAVPDEEGGVVVTVQVTNVDPRRRRAADVRVTDAPPEGLEYEWGSARRDDRPGSRVEVSGANPYHFGIGAVAHGDRALLSYRAIPRKTEAKGKSDRGASETKSWSRAIMRLAVASACAVGALWVLGPRGNAASDDLASTWRGRRQRRV